MKRILVIGLLLVGLLVVPIKASFASSDITVLLEGNELIFDVQPQMIEGRTLLPLRAIFEALGLEVSWNDSTRVITGTGEGIEIILKLDSKEAKVNGINKTLDVPAKAINGRTLVPVRFIAESLDMIVGWNQESKTVVIDKKSEIVEFKDPNFEKAVRDNIKKPEGVIYKSDVKNVTSLYMGSYPTNTPTTKVSNLEGIQHFTNLEDLFINVNNTINNLAPLKELTSLKEINIWGSEVYNLEPLRNLINLEELDIGDAYIYDVEPIKGLINLKELSLINNNISSIDSLKNLTNLETIMLSDNNFDSIDVLKNLKYLKTVVIHSTKVSDISVLAELPKLEFVGAFDIPITITDFAKVYQPGVKKGIHILTSFNESELLNIQVAKESISVADKNLIENKFHIDELFKRLSISDYVEIFNNNGVYFKNDEIFRLSKSKYYEDGSISYHDSYGENKLIGRFDIGKQNNLEFDDLKEELKNKYGRPFTEDLEEENYRNARITRWSGIELRRYSDSVRGETTQLWIIVQEGSGKSELAINKKLSISEIKAYLTSKYATLNTNIGTTKFTFNIQENESSNRPYDYWIQVEYEYEFFEGAMNSIKYSSEQKSSLRRELKEHQKDIGESLIELLPDKKLYGGYYDSRYRYPNLKVDLITRSYYSWTNYDEPDYLSDLDSYDQTEPSYFRWDDLIDDEL